MILCISIATYKKHMNSVDAHILDDSKRYTAHEKLGSRAGVVGSAVVGLSFMTYMMGNIASMSGAQPILPDVGSLSMVEAVGVGGLATLVAGAAYNSLARLGRIFNSLDIRSDPNRENKLKEVLDEKLTKTLYNTQDFSIKDLEMIKKITANKEKPEEIKEQITSYRQHKNKLNS